MSYTCMSAQGAGVTKLAQEVTKLILRACATREQEGTVGGLVAVSSTGAVSSTDAVSSTGAVSSIGAVSSTGAVSSAGEGTLGCLVALWVADTHHVRAPAHRRHRSHAPALRSHTRH